MLFAERVVARERSNSFFSALALDLIFLGGQMA